MIGSTDPKPPVAASTTWRACAAMVVMAMANHTAHAQNMSPEEAERRCGPVATPGHYGPFEYRANRERLLIVEKHHFTPAIEAGTLGSNGTAGLMKELAYTLKASPNHHRALLTLAGQGAKLKVPQPEGLEYSIECFFDRAIRFQPGDPIVRMIFSQYLAQQGRVPDARQQLEVAKKSADDNPLTHHNIGLAYFDMNEFDLALAQAHMARKLGFQRSRLETLLKQQGKWKDAGE